MSPNPPLRLVDGAGQPLPREADKAIADAVRTCCESLKKYSPAFLILASTTDGLNSINGAGGDPFKVLDMSIGAIAATAGTIQKNYESSNPKEPIDGP